MGVGRLLGVGFIVLLARPAEGQEWPRFRGPNGSGVSRATTVPVRWTEKEFDWRIEFPGKGHSSPVLWGNRLFLTSGLDDTGARVVLCIAADDGRVLWSKRFEGRTHKKHALNSFASATPAVDERRVYLSSATPEEHIVQALDHDGEEAWRVDLGPFKSSHGSGVSPILHEGMVIVPHEHEGDSSLVALDCRSGETRWRIARDTKTTYTTPCVYRREGRPAALIFTNWKHGITAVNPDDGKTVWETSPFDQKHVETAIGSPIVSGDLVLGTCGWLGYATHTVAVRPDDETPGEARVVYRMDRGAPLTTTPLVKDGLLFLWADEGIVTCADAADGTIHWRKRVGGTFYGSPVAAGEAIYCVSADGEAVVLAASKEFRLIARNPLGEGSHSTPAVAGGRMYLRTFSHLISIGGRSRTR